MSIYSCEQTEVCSSESGQICPPIRHSGYTTGKYERLTKEACTEGRAAKVKIAHLFQKNVFSPHFHPPFVIMSKYGEQKKCIKWLTTVGTSEIQGSYKYINHRELMIKKGTLRRNLDDFSSVHTSHKDRNLDKKKSLCLCVSDKLEKSESSAGDVSCHVVGHCVCRLIAR